MIADNKQSGFLPRVEALRGLAALCVANYHIALVTGQAVGDSASRDAAGSIQTFLLKLYMATGNGFGAVAAFFVISGFVLARSLERSMQGNRGWLSRYFVSRIFRLFPASIFAVGFFALLYASFGIKPLGGSFEPLNILMNMAMLRFDIDPVMWSMQVELLATPVILLATFTVPRYGAWPVYAAIAILFGLSFIPAYDYALGARLAPFYAFLFGVLTHFHGAEIARRIGPVLATPVAIACVVFFCLCGVIGNGAWRLLVLTFAAAYLIALIVWQPQLRIFRPLDWPIVRFYGRISYSFYLLHPLTMWVVEQMAGPLKTIDASGIPLVLVIFVLSIASIALVTPLAYLAWRLVELPGVALGRQVITRREIDPEPASQSSRSAILG